MSTQLPHHESIARVHVKIAGEIAAVHESRLRLWIKPRPRWCPERLWRWMIRTVLVQGESPLLQRSGQSFTFDRDPTP